MKKNQDQLFAQLLCNDRIGEPDNAIEDRLMYSFLLKNSSSKVKQNSFASFFNWLFSAQSLGLKTGLVSLVLFFSVINNQLNIDAGTICFPNAFLLPTVPVLFKPSIQSEPTA